MSDAPERLLVPAPERIWLFAANLKQYLPGGGKISMGDVEYIRADAAEAKLAEVQLIAGVALHTQKQLEADLTAAAARANAAEAALAAQGEGERVQHVKRGSAYRVIGRGKVQTDTPLTDYSEVVIYQGETDGLIWVRPVAEFDDGRFDKLEPHDRTALDRLIAKAEADALRRAADAMCHPSVGEDLGP